MHPMLNVAVRAARKAGRIINRASLDIDQVKIARKQRNDFVTEVDHAAEQAIIETLLTAFPGHSILAEESGHTPAKGAAAEARDADFVWVIDPLDGTTNFIHGLPQYCISIALMERGVITQGLVYDPNRDELFTATKGRGAFLNDRRIRVASRTRLEESLIGTGFPFRRIEDLDRYLVMLKAVMQKAAGLRRPGAAAPLVNFEAAGLCDEPVEIQKPA